MVTAENLLDVNERYIRFLQAAKKRTSDFQESLIVPVIGAVKKLIDIFEKDLNEVVFRGLNEAMSKIDVVYGPAKDAMDYFVGRVVRNTKLISLHLSNLVTHDYKFEDLEGIIEKTVEFGSATAKSLPRYYSMVTDVPETMKELGFDFDSLIFPPQRLAHESDNCSREVDTFVNGTHNAMTDLNLTLNIINSWDSGSKDLNLKATLNYLFENLFEYESNFELLKDNCFDEFIDTVNEIREFFKSHMEEVKEDTDIEYSFNFDEETEDIYKEKATFYGYVDQYLHRSNMSKFTLQEVLTEDWLNDVIDTQVNFMEKVKIRLTESLLKKLDEARVDLTGWYEDLIRRASAMRQFMSPNFFEKRLSQMNIWKAPMAQVFKPEQIVCTRKLSFCFCYLLETESTQF